MYDIKILYYASCSMVSGPLYIIFKLSITLSSGRHNSIWCFYSSPQLIIPGSIVLMEYIRITIIAGLFVPIQMEMMIGQVICMADYGFR